MPFNWLVLPTLVISYLLFWCGYRIPRRLKSRRDAIIVGILTVALAAPGLLIAVYYLHLLDNWRGFYEFRSFRGSEFAAAGLGLAGGLISRWPARGPRLRSVSIAVVAITMTAGIFLPHAKPLLAPAKTAKFRNSWDRAVCLQSSTYSCGAACAATVLRHHGIKATEAQIARECFTYRGGTENWYIARALRNRGLGVRFVTKMPDSGIPVPCIAGVKIGGAGHFITVLEDLGGSYRTGDPLVGERVHGKDSIPDCYQFTGFFMAIGPK